MKEIRKTYIALTETEDTALDTVESLANFLEMCDNSTLVELGTRLNAIIDEVDNFVILEPYADPSEYEIVNDFDLQFEPFEEPEIDVE